ncbi:MAG: hypothetical protein SOY73_15910 [Blautia sp.]|nr:hypothetical protein [Blautia sp.]MDY4000545.1 hypothetical protein [Blautia sp.]
MRKFSKVMVIIACVFLALGIGFSAAGAAMGADLKDVDLSDDFRDGIQIMKNIRIRNSRSSSDDTGSSKEEKSSGGGTRTFTVEAADSVEIELRSDELVLQEYSGDQIKIEIENDKEENVKVISSSTNLKIKSSGLKSSRCVTVFYPAGKRFSEMEISVDAGSAYIESEFLADKLKVEIGAGEFISSAPVDVSELDVEVGAGSFEASSLKAVKIDGECGMGSLVLNINGKETDYNYKLECGIGEISINGDSYGGLGSEKKITNPGASGEIDLECGIGEIEAEFYE